ncbi:hypothetical protein N7512_004680 [Penicillium capsulatum]|nr:hypothetical protein N7512_004680 [Penicillium capsulatum]
MAPSPLPSGRKGGNTRPKHGMTRLGIHEGIINGSDFSAASVKGEKSRYVLRFPNNSCDGNSPCKTCMTKGLQCQRHTSDMRGKWRDSKKAAGSPKNFASRLALVEHQLGLMNPKSRSPMLESCSRIRDSTPQAQVTSFSGETSITHNLTVVEDRLEQMGVQYEGMRSPPPNHSFSRLTPAPGSSTGRIPEISGRNPFSRLLNTHGIVPDRKKWDELMQTFCDEVHILVPFLHLPTVRDVYEKTWTRLMDLAPNVTETRGVYRVQTAHVLLCLANGRCVESSRFEGDQGPYSAGGSLYSAARGIFGDLLDGLHQCADQILVLQTVLLMVIYLFRLDAHELAEKTLALSISHAHHLGLQRNRVVEKMPLFEGEMSRRLWWCIYLLDRRLAIETGRPFLIQDMNIDIGLPRNVSDEWLTSQGATQETSMPENNARSEPNTVPYLIAMASYSRVIGKVWEALYGAATSKSTASPLLHEYLEHFINESQKGIQQEFAYDPFHPAGGNTSRGLAWWQIKQQFMMRIRWSSLYLLIRKPMLHKTWCSEMPVPEAIENEVICMRLARRILDDFRQVPEEHPKYTFPFLHYLTNATIIALGLIIKQPSFRRTYGALTLNAAQSLKEHCRKTWVSRKMIQTVWKLNEMAEAILESRERPSENVPRGFRPTSAAEQIDLPGNKSGGDFSGAGVYIGHSSFSIKKIKYGSVFRK